MRLAMATLVALLAFASPALASSVTVHSVDNTSPTAAAGARTVYAVEFTTTNAIATNQQITIGFPSGTTFTGGITTDVFVGTTDVGGCFSPAGLEVQCFVNSAVPAGTRVKVVLAGVTNPTPAGPQALTVRTTSDADAAQGAFTAVAPGTISAVALTNAPPTAAAGGRTLYEVQFTTSATGGMSGTANSRFTVTFPTGTTFTGGVTSDVFVGTTDVGGCFSPGGLAIECFINTTVAPGARVRATFGGVTNPGPGQHHVSVTTTSDPAPINSNDVTVAGAGTVSNVALTNAPPTNAAGGRTFYEVQFTTSATGGMSATANSRFTVTFPTGTTFTGGVSSNVFVGTTDVGGCFSPSGLAIECFLNTAVAPGARVRVTFAGVTNPPAGQRHVSVATTSDPAPIGSNDVTVVAGNAVSAATLAVANPSAAATTRYTFEFTTSATGGISAAANSRIMLTFPAGTTFVGASGDVFVGAPDVGSCFSPTGLEMECFVNSASVASNTRVRVVVDGVRNPGTGSYSASVRTTSDLPPVAAAFGIGQDTIAPDTTLGGSPFTFTASEPGSSFECSIDGGEYSPCTSPFTPPALAPGEHTFSVRAVDGAGNRDPSPATTTFVVEQPLPVPTVSPMPTPTPPEPTPQFNQSVVVEPAGGTVQVCPKGGACFTLTAGQTIPMGSTVDTKKGAVELTSVSAPGAPKQTAVFSEGIFRITQRGSFTELKLTEPLATCPKKKARAAAKKKPKSRKLWGKGSGKFRTVGNYSAATIRGTRWLTQDSCAGTLTRVTEGVVNVTAGKKLVVVRAGKSYLAKPRR